jgi:hypothetical protein
MSMLGQDSSPYSSAALHDGHTACIRDPLGTCYFFQGGDLDIIQGARLREETGEKLGYHTGGGDCEKKQGTSWDISQGVDL